MRAPPAGADRRPPRRAAREGRVAGPRPAAAVESSGIDTTLRTAADLRAIREAIDRETRRRNLPAVRERVERDRIERDGLAFEPDVTENGAGSGDGRPCKTDGCPNRANDRYTRGPYSGLCAEACIPVRREEISRQASEDYRRRRSGGSALPVLHPEPPPAPPAPEAPAPPADPDPDDQPSLSGLADDLEAALEHLQDAQDAYELAVSRLAAHPALHESWGDLEEARRLARTAETP